MKDGGLVDYLKRDPSNAPLDSRQHAIVEYAIKLTLTPWLMTEIDMAPLRKAGLSDSGIHDAAAIASYFNFVNRMALGLGVELEPQA